MSDLIDREALKDAVKRYAGEPIKKKDRKCQAICLDMLGIIDAQPAADALECFMKLNLKKEEEMEFVGIDVSYPDPEVCTYKEYRGKPYFGIKYKHNGDIFVGFGTYKPEILSGYIRKFFINQKNGDDNGTD